MKLVMDSSVKVRIISNSELLNIPFDDLLLENIWD